MSPRLRSLLAGFGLAALAALPASAQTSNVRDWSGVHVGLNAGAAFTRTTMDDSVCRYADATCYFTPSAASIPTSGRVAAAAHSRQNTTWATFGGQVGYNYQIGPIVLGAEADIGMLRGKVKHTGTTSYLNNGTTGATLSDALTSDWLLTFRGRVGYAYQNLGMVYLTGGLALANLQRRGYLGEFGFNSPANNPVPCGGTPYSNYCSTNAFGQRTGWTAGAGVEVPVWGGFSMKVEYLYADFGTKNGSAPLRDGAGTSQVFAGGGATVRTGQTVAQSFSFAMHMVRVGVNYNF